MAILDFIKNKKEDKDAKKKPAKKVLSTKKLVKKVDEIKDVKTVQPMQKTNISNVFSYEVVKQPHISEKSTSLMEDNKYVFKIMADQNKNDIKKAVEGIYNVNVISVRKISIPAKKRRVGRREGFRKAYQKAIVTIKDGQKIEIL